MLCHNIANCWKQKERLISPKKINLEMPEDNPCFKVKWRKAYSTWSKRVNPSLPRLAEWLPMEETCSIEASRDEKDAWNFQRELSVRTVFRIEKLSPYPQVGKIVLHALRIPENLDRPCHESNAFLRECLSIFYTICSSHSFLIVHLYEKGHHLTSLDSLHWQVSCKERQIQTVK